jgi:hypothetical protein
VKKTRQSENPEHGSDSIRTDALGVRFFEISRAFSFRLKGRAGIDGPRSCSMPQVRYACAKLDSKSQQISARLRYLTTSAVPLLDKSKLFHKIFMSRLN